MKKLDVNPKDIRNIVSYAIFKSMITLKIRKALAKKHIFYTDEYLEKLSSESIMAYANEVRRLKPKINKVKPI